MQAMLSVAHQRVIPLLVPSTALSDAYADLKPDAAHALSAIVQFPLLTVAALDEADARGRASCARTSTARPAPRPGTSRIWRPPGSGR